MPLTPPSAPLSRAGGRGEGEREGGSTHGWRRGLRLCRSFGAEFLNDLPSSAAAPPAVRKGSALPDPRLKIKLFWLSRLPESHRLSAQSLPA